MDYLKRKQIMDQKVYEINSITEAGIEDGSSVMISEFKAYGKLYDDSFKEKVKLMNKLQLIQDCNSYESRLFKQDSAKSWSANRKESSTAIKDILIRENKIKDAMTPQETS